MNSESTLVQKALAGRTRGDVLSALGPARSALTLPELQRLAQHLETLTEPTAPLRIGILHTYTSDLLDPYLHFEALLQGLAPAIYHGPYGAIVQESQPASGLVGHKPQLTVMLLRWEDLDPGFGGAFTALSVDDAARLAERARGRLMQQVGAVRGAIDGHLLITLLPPDRGPGLGDYDTMAPVSEHAWREGLKASIAAELLGAYPSTTLLDLDHGVTSLGRERFFDRRWWYTSRFPFSPAGAQDLARRVVAVGAVLKRPRAKVIALDADNTLWGGIIGEDGMEGIALGPDYPGNCYVAFQRRLLEYQQRGFILALCSKNNEADVREVLRRHPHQVLREEHFAALRVNWQPKPDNLRSLAEELNLGLDSIVFVDDSAHECGIVRQTLPMVDVVLTPARAVDVPVCLDRLSRLEVVALTEEDRRKTAMYVQDRKRRDLAASGIDLPGYLRSLQMEISVSLDDRRQIARIAQLSQKTNQFTLTTRRYTEDEVARLIQAEDWLVAHFSLRDIFGESGIVGIALVRQTAPDLAELDTFLMSCRVIGRMAETAFLETILETLRRRGVTTLLADYLPTPKNGLVAAFLPEHHFRLRPDGRYVRALDGADHARDIPILVRLADETPALSA